MRDFEVDEAALDSGNPFHVEVQHDLEFAGRRRPLVQAPAWVGGCVDRQPDEGGYPGFFKLGAQPAPAAQHVVASGQELEDASGRVSRRVQLLPSQPVLSTRATLSRIGVLLWLRLFL